MTPPVNPGKQRVVAYDREGKLAVYATAYSDEEAQDVILECEARYGKVCKPRTMYADAAEAQQAQERP